MKRILITGKNSYIGTSFKKFEKKNDNFFIDEVDTKNHNWEKISYDQYDTIFHVAGIAHVSADPKLEHLYYEINRDLTFKIAKKAKKEGIKQFIFMSSIIVYGKNEAIIRPITKPNPENFYGKSKLEAEKYLKSLENDSFKVVILRPPMIYGKNSKGNYPLLSKLSKKTLVFPKYNNKRSMLHVDNLCKLIELLINNNERGTYYPQNKEYVCTSDLVQMIAKCHNHKIFFTNVFNPIIKAMQGYELVNKVFGNLIYDKKMSEYNENYQIRNLQKSVKLTEDV